MQYFIHLGYDGTNFNGWQKQVSTDNTIQGILETILFKIFKYEVRVFGCGRTDTGVHASQYFANIGLDEAPSFDLKFRLNKNLPDRVAVFDIIETSHDQHSRYHATSRTYDYFIHLEKNPLLMRCSSYYGHYDLDIDRMKEVAKLYAVNQNFRPFCKQPDLYKNTWCQISNCELFYDDASKRLRFTISSNRFLRGMIRYCVYFMLEVGRGKISMEEFKAILNREKEVTQKAPAAPNGLFLSKVDYPFLEMDNKHHIFNLLKIGLQH